MKNDGPLSVSLHCCHPSLISLLLLPFSLLQSFSSLLSQYERNSNRWRDHFSSCLFRFLSSSQYHSDIIFFSHQGQIYHFLQHILKIFSCQRWLENLTNLVLSVFYHVFFLTGGLERCIIQMSWTAQWTARYRRHTWAVGLAKCKIMWCFWHLADQGTCWTVKIQQPQTVFLL